MQRGVAAHVLHVEADEEIHAGHREEHQGDRGSGRRQPRIAEQPDIERWIRDPRLVPPETSQDGNAAGDRPQHVTADPRSGVAALDDAVHDKHEASDRQQHPEIVDLSWIQALGLRDQQQDRSYPGGRERHIDQEDRSPPEMVEQQAARDRADRNRHADCCRPDADGTSPFPRVEDVGDDRQRLRHDRGAAQAHGGPRPDELPGRVRVRGDQRGDAEHRHPDHQHPLAADPVADHAEGEQQPGEDQGVGVDRPLQLTLARAQPAHGLGLGDRLEGDIQHGVVEDDRNQADDQDAEDDPSAPVNSLRIHDALRSMPGRPGLTAVLLLAPRRGHWHETNNDTRRHRIITGQQPGQAATGQAGTAGIRAYRPYPDRDSRVIIDKSGDAAGAPRDVEASDDVAP